MGNLVELPESPRRIISLVPSQTELLHDLGLDQQVVGITKFCVYPDAWRKAKTIIGGTKNFNFEVIASLRPDLIIGNKEENYHEGILQLRRSAPVWISDVVTFENALDMIHSVGALTGRGEAGFNIVRQIQMAFSQLNPVPPVRVLYLMWHRPWMGAARSTFIDTMLNRAGLKNVLRPYERYPEVSVDLMKKLDPDVVLLSTEPFPFSEMHKAEVLEILPRAKVIIVDGEMFSWYGSRLRLAPSYFNGLNFQP